MLGGRGCTRRSNLLFSGKARGLRAAIAPVDAMAGRDPGGRSRVDSGGRAGEERVEGGVCYGGGPRSFSARMSSTVCRWPEGVRTGQVGFPTW